MILFRNIGRKLGKNKIGEDFLSTCRIGSVFAITFIFNLSNTVGIWNRKLYTELWGKH